LVSSLEKFPLAIKTILEDDILRNKLSQRGKDLIDEQYNWVDLSKRFANLLKEIAISHK